MGERQKAVHDWTYLPFIGITSAGFLVASLDFVLLQGLILQWSAVVGPALRVLSTRGLVKGYVPA